MTDCVFCKIVRGDLPSEQIYEDDIVVAFLSIGPMSPGHALIIPKAHRKDFMSLTTDEILHVFRYAQVLGEKLCQVVPAQGFNLITNNGAAAGQEIFHAHIHIIPRQEGDELKHWPVSESAKAEMPRIGEQMREAMQDE